MPDQEDSIIPKPLIALQYHQVRNQIKLTKADMTKYGLQEHSIILKFDANELSNAVGKCVGYDSMIGYAPLMTESSVDLLRKN